GSIWSSLSTSQMIRSTPAARARRTASAMPPATRTWLSLIIAASHRPMRWFCAPPIRVAYFSRCLSPGIVLRVSSNTVPFSPIASTYVRVIVAMPERCWTTFSALRSAVSIARALPDKRINRLAAGTGRPSSTSSSISIAGSSARKNAAATGKPATTMASRLSITPEKRASAGITLSDVTSCPPPGRPSPRSSARVARTKVSRSKPGSVKSVIRAQCNGPGAPARAQIQQPPSVATGGARPQVPRNHSERKAPRTERADARSEINSVDEPRHHVSVRATDLHFGPRAENEEAFPIGVRPDLTNLVEVHDRRAMDTLEHARVEAALEVLHRLAQDQRVVAGIDAHVIARGFDMLDRVHVDAEYLPAVLDVDH